MDLYPVSIDREGELGPIDVSLRNDGPGEWHENRVMYMVAIVDGTAYAYRCENYEREFVYPEWELLATIGPAEDVAIEFDGHWERIPNGRYRFYSEGEPWMFWVTEGILYAWQAPAAPFELASGNITRVSVVRGWKNISTPSNDQGVVVAYIKDGYAKYRNRAEQVDESKIWESEKDITDEHGTPLQAVNISAFRTIDYRTGFLHETGGEIHMVVTRRDWAQMGVPPELITGSLTNYSTALREVYYTVLGSGAFPNESDPPYRSKHHQKGPYKGDPAAPYLQEKIGAALLEYSTTALWAGETVPVMVENIDNGEGDWGEKVKITFDRGISDAGDAGAFKLVDAEMNEYPAQAIALGEAWADPIPVGRFDGTREIVLTCVDFNPASDPNGEAALDLVYEGPGPTGEATQTVEPDFTFSFTAYNLTPPEIDEPEVEAIWNE